MSPAASLLGDGDVRGEVLGVVYRDATSGFGVVEVDLEGHLTRASGPLADLVEGQHVRLVGSMRDHAKYGPTFEAVFYEQVAPDTVAGLRTFLGSERFEQVPDSAIVRVLTQFGARAGAVIEHEPSRLVDEANIPEDVADDLHQAWMAGAALARLVVMFEPLQVPMGVVRAAHRTFGADAATLLQADPWALLEVERARFAHADALARHQGGSPTDPARLAAGARAAVGGARRGEGHQVVAWDHAVRLAAGLLGVDVVAAADGLERSIEAGVLADDVAVTSTGGDVPQRVVSTPAGLRAEQGLASRLVALARASSALVGLVDVDEVHVDDELTAGQQRAVRAALGHTTCVLVGGPGTGKTRTIRELVAAARAAGAEVALCAPTGRAAKRMEELVDHEATTIHRLLGARPLPGGGFVFGHDRDDPLAVDLVVVDEVSMCDTALLRSLLAAIEDGAHVLLVGDPDQLPSVGTGDVLADVVASGTVPVVELTEIHRQAAGSRIVSLSREINGGVVGHLRGVDGDVFMAQEARRDRITPRVVDAVAERAPAYFDVDVEDIQVVAPMYRGPCGVDALNGALKARLNPDRGQARALGFQAGDRVMVTRNDPELDVSNGDIGTVVQVGRQQLDVRLGDREVKFDAESGAELTLAWAITVHKSQGGQWPVVVLVADRSHDRMLRRNLLYTAVSRAQRALIIVGQAEAVQRAASRDDDRARCTTLRARLRAGWAT